jgi:hypothetical protein
VRPADQKWVAGLGALLLIAPLWFVDNDVVRGCGVVVIIVGWLISEARGDERGRRLGFMAGYFVVTFVSSALIFRHVLGVSAVAARVIGMLASAVALGALIARSRIVRSEASGKTER